MTLPLATQAGVALAALEGLSRAAADYQALSDPELLNLSTIAASIQRLATTHAAMIAGDVARRSVKELGTSGLAQRAGFRTAEELIRATTGSTAIEASRSVRVGTLIHDSSSAMPQRPWLAPVSAAIAAGELSASGADAIRAGLGEASDEITTTMLAEAAGTLCTEAFDLDAERLYRRARALRDELDETGIVDREAARRAQRSLRFVRLADGMALITWRLDPESAAACAELFDRATSPRRGGPRFVAESDRLLAERILADERTVEQIASDSFLELLRQGAAADSSNLLASGAPVVRVIVTQKALDERLGHGWLEGQTDPISIQTVERLVCAGSVQSVTIDDLGNPLDVGREQRLFTRRQRIALAVRDGGCRWPGCERPPSWSEAHHVEHWKRDRGKTDTANGILLCRYHHLQLHNDHWDIQRSGQEYALIPPSTAIDKRVRPMPSKSPLAREYEAAR